MKRGDLVLMVVPSDLGRPRPGVIVQTDELGQNTTTILVCPISSDIDERLPIRPTLEPDSDNGLRLRSQVMTDKMLAVRRDGIRRIIGTLDQAKTEELDRALLIVLGLAR